MRPVRIQRVSQGLFIPSLRLVRERKGVGWVGMVIGHRTLVFSVIFYLELSGTHCFVRELDIERIGRHSSNKVDACGNQSRCETA
jgi:hypothetical protein